MSLASSVGAAQEKAVTQRAQAAELFTCWEWETLGTARTHTKALYVLQVVLR